VARRRPPLGGPSPSSGSFPRSGPVVPERAVDVRAALRELGVSPSKGWGQSFLTDPFVADAESAVAGPPTPGGIVEIGGGLGMLTAALVRRGWDPITVLERDRRLARFLRTTFAGRVRVLEEDARAAPVGTADCYIGNLPYSIATPLLLRLLADRAPRVVFLVQREVAERLAASPGSKTYGRLSIVAQLYGTIELYRTVPAEAFTPRPRVESRLAAFERRPGPLPVPSVTEFERLVRTLFSARRKQLGNLLPRCTSGPAEAEALARAAEWPSDWARRRPEELPPTSYFALARASAARDHPE
jgi:16S rRNA (adenine1518-N6/adenine1519-N6)-dimethyltransferase